jgi:hypothetical protein
VSEDLYSHLSDDAVEYLNSAEKRLEKVRDALLQAGGIGERLSNRKAQEAIYHIVEARKLIDQLPAEIGIQISDEKCEWLDCELPATVTTSTETTISGIIRLCNRHFKELPA